MQFTFGLGAETSLVPARRHSDGSGDGDLPSTIIIVWFQIRLIVSGREPAADESTNQIFGGVEQAQRSTLHVIVVLK